MVAKNVNMVKVAQAAPKEEIKPPTYRELTAALQLGINTFLTHHIQSILATQIKDHTTVAHIMAHYASILKMDISIITDALAPYTLIDKMAEEHIAVNNWPNSEVFFPELTRIRFGPVPRTPEHLPPQVTDQQIHKIIYIPHVIRFFEKKVKRTR